jgi:hypothetical protein
MTVSPSAGCSTDYTGWGFSWFFSVPPGECWCRPGLLLSSSLIIPPCYAI